MDEGYIKFNINWNEQEIAFDAKILKKLNAVRKRLRQLGYLGELPNGIGFGNISVRVGKQFIITGSATGGLVELEQKHMALVSDYDIQMNRLTCSGETKASSESLSHAAIYEKCPSVKAVIHIHFKPLWNKYLHILPTSDETAAYGTPEMARSIKTLIETTSPKGILLMGGHEDGILSYGQNLNAAFDEILTL